MSPRYASRMRLNKAVAATGLCSRRKADSYILEGRILVNGQVVDEPGRQIDPEADALAFDGAPLKAPQSRDFEYVVMYKPIKVITSAHDPQGRETVMDLLPKSLRPKRLFPVGRLDFFSEGLLLLTTDGDLAHRMMHPRHHMPKTYDVLVRGAVTEAKLQQIRGGMTLEEGDKLAPIDVERLKPGEGMRKNATLLRMTLRQGKNRQIRKMCKQLEFTIIFLKRISQGPIELGNMRSGECRTLTPKEINALKNATKL